MDLRAAGPGGDGALTRRELEAMASELDRAQALLVEAIEEAKAFGAEMVARTAELDGMHDLFEAALARSPQPLLVLDAHMVVRGWSGGAASRFGTGAERAVGRRLSSLRCTGLPAARIASAARDVLAGRSPTGGEVPFACYPVTGRRGGRQAVIVVFEPAVGGRSGIGRHAAPEPGDDVRQPS